MYSCINEFPFEKSFNEDDNLRFKPWCHRHLHGFGPNGPHGSCGRDSDSSVDSFIPRCHRRRHHRCRSKSPITGDGKNDSDHPLTHCHDAHGPHGPHSPCRHRRNGRHGCHGPLPSLNLCHSSLCSDKIFDKMNFPFECCRYGDSLNSKCLMKCKGHGCEGRKHCYRFGRKHHLINDLCHEKHKRLLRMHHKRNIMKRLRRLNRLNLLRNGIDCHRLHPYPAMHGHHGCFGFGLRGHGGLRRHFLYKKLFKNAFPTMNLSEDDNCYSIQMDLPGMTKDQINIEMNNDQRIITISGERKWDDNEEINDCDSENEKDYENNSDDSDDSECEDSDSESDADEESEDESSDSENDDSEDDMDQDEEEEENKNKNCKKLNKEKNDDAFQELNNFSNSNDGGNIKENQDTNHKKYRMMECGYGKFERSIHIPKDGDLSSINAKMENGVLIIKINKKEKESPKQNIHTIQIE